MRHPVLLLKLTLSLIQISRRSFELERDSKYGASNLGDLTLCLDSSSGNGIKLLL